MFLCIHVPLIQSDEHPTKSGRLWNAMLAFNFEDEFSCEVSWYERFFNWVYKSSVEYYGVSAKCVYRHKETWQVNTCSDFTSNELLNNSIEAPRLFCAWWPLWPSINAVFSYSLILDHSFKSFKWVVLKRNILLRNFELISLSCLEGSSLFSKCGSKARSPLDPWHPGTGNQQDYITAY